MGTTTTNIIEIVNSGVNVIIDAEEETTLSIIEIVKTAVKKDVQVLIKNSNSETTSNLIEIAKIGKKNVTLDLTE